MPAPDDQPNNRREREAEAAALLLLLARKRYDLPALVATLKTNPRPMRRIGPTSAIESNLAAPFLQIARAWQAEQPGLVAAYSNATATGDLARLHASLDAAAARAEQVTAFVRRQIAPVIQRMEQWHRIAWVARVKAATGIDIGAFTSAAEVAPEIANAVAWNEALAADVNAQATGRIASRVIGAAANKAPATRAEAKATGLDPAASVEDMIADAVTKARTRAKNIAVDQAEKTSAGMTDGRAASAGLGLWRWKHYDPQPHPRPEHIKRDGNIYSSVRPPPTQPAEEPFCKCYKQWLFRAE